MGSQLAPRRSASTSYGLIYGDFAGAMALSDGTISTLTTGIALLTERLGSIKEQLGKLASSQATMASEHSSAKAELTASIVKVASDASAHLRESESRVALDVASLKADLASIKGDVAILLKDRSEGQMSKQDMSWRVLLFIFTTGGGALLMGAISMWMAFKPPSP